MGLAEIVGKVGTKLADTDIYVPGVPYLGTILKAGALALIAYGSYKSVKSHLDEKKEGNISTLLEEEGYVE